MAGGPGALPSQDSRRSSTAITRFFFLILSELTNFNFILEYFVVTFAIPPSWPILAIVCPLNGSFVALKDNKDQDL